MKRVIKFICIMLVSTLFLVVFSSCSNKEYESGDFKYSIYGKKDDPHILIVGLTKEGKEKEVLVVPSTINGISVRALEKPHLPLLGSTSTIWESTKLKKIILPSNVDVAKFTFDGCPLLKQIFMVIGSDSQKIFNHYELYKKSFDIFVPKDYYNLNSEFMNIKPANVNYYYNFERADNDGVFWIDNVDEGALIVDVPPTEPIRERWTFGGWYTEPECINKWNFSADTVSADGVSLYAKWL